MRPRVFPAEDPAIHRRRPQLDIASMRPRVFPAEDHVQRCQDADGDGAASMRPRVFPAEDPEPSVDLDRSHEGFNEAAGIPRGRLIAGRLFRSHQA